MRVALARRTRAQRAHTHVLFPLLSLSGPFNSWDRDPYVFDDVQTGQLTMVKAMDEIAHNFIIVRREVTKRA